MHSLTNIKILVVEDDRLNQTIARQVLLSWHAEVDIAENGKEALEKLKKRRYDLVLMDIHMPEMDGYETTKYIRANFRNPLCNIPIVALTSPVEGERQKCYVSGMDGYIRKPFDMSELNEKICDILNLGFKSYHLN